MMSVRGINRVSSITRRVWAKSARRAVVLAYHRVAQPATDPQLLAVTPRHFEQQMRILGRSFAPMSLGELLDAVRRNAVPPRAVAVTFDDGYADNLTHAAPVLAEQQVPATVFVVSDQVGSEREFWWDDLERMLLSEPYDHTQLSVTIAGRAMQWDLPPHPVDGATGGRFRAWDVTSAATPTTRHEAYRTLVELLKGLGGQSRRDLLTGIANALRQPVGGREAHLAMTGEQLRELTRDSLIEIGGHTATHPKLAARPIDEQRGEIAQCRSWLGEIVGRPLRFFSYPFGGINDFTTETIEAVAQAGFDAACANVPGVVTSTATPYTLPRFLVRDWDGAAFEKRLSVWFAAGAGRVTPVAA
jgi:peptidoglycan/xylan/chitin deacetylase (PgdA/CDA1 family)